MDPGAKRKVVESLAGLQSGLIFLELRCLDNHTLGPVAPHRAHVDNKIVAIRIAPIRAEHRHESAAARLINLFYVVPGCGVSQILPGTNLGDAILERSRQKHFEYMSDTVQKLMTQVTVIDQLSVLGQVAQR